MRNCAIRFLTVGLLWWSFSVHASGVVPAPRDTVVRLYSDFSSEIVLEEPMQTGLWGQPIEVWAKYFSKNVVALYARALKCELTNVICAREMSPIWYSQDPGTVTVRIEPGNGPLTVVASVRYPKDAIASGTAKLQYQMVNEGGSWKIANIKYPDSSTLVGWLSDALK